MSFSPTPGEMIQFDEHIFSYGLKPPTSKKRFVVVKTVSKVLWQIKERPRLFCFLTCAPPPNLVPAQIVGGNIEASDMVEIEIEGRYQKIYNLVGLSRKAAGLLRW